MVWLVTYLVEPGDRNKIRHCNGIQRRYKPLVPVVPKLTTRRHCNFSDGSIPFGKGPVMAQLAMVEQLNK